MSCVHNTVHCVMVIILLCLGYLYLQMKDRLDSCNTFQSDSMKKRDFSQLFISRTYGHQLIQSSDVDLNTISDDSHYGTKESGQSFLSISESQFESGLIAIETTEQLIISSEFDIVQISQNEGASTTSSSASIQINQVMQTSQMAINQAMSTSQMTINHFTEAITSSPTEHSDTTLTSTNNTYMVRNMTQNVFTKDLIHKYPTYLENDKTETVTSKSNVIVTNTKFISQSQSASQTSKLLISRRQMVSHVTHISDDIATNIRDTNVEPPQMAASVIMTTEQKNDFCMSQDCAYLSGTVLNDLETIVYVEEENTDFPFPKTLHSDESVKIEAIISRECLTIGRVADEKSIDHLISQGTSVFCENKGKLCHFQNLCYKKKEKDFVFLIGEKSVVESSTTANYTEMFTINLSTVPDHNAHMITLVSIPAQSLTQFTTAVVDQTTFIMSRFKPDNIMHVLHDDILPLFNTLDVLHLQHFNNKPNVALIYTDNFHSGEFIDLYSSLSSTHPISLSMLNTSADVICFTDTYIGLSTSTLWYQYGFFKPQGPLILNNTDILQKVRKAAKYLAEHFQKECFLCKNQNHIVLISRKDNRLILNEGELAMSLARATKLKVMSVSLEMQSLSEIISIVRSSKGIIGMHGSLLSLSIFLQPGSVVVELFPYGINPSKYSPFKTFSQLPGTGIVYMSWVNPHLHKSVGHPDWPPELGGVHHLPSHIQDKILHESEVEDHLCCSDPSWLYHIYQDTEVDIDAVTSLTATSLTQAETMQHQALLPTSSIPYLPGPVQNISCSHVLTNDISGYQVTWSLPWNLGFIPYTFVHSQLVYQDKTQKDSRPVNVELSIVSYIIKTTETHSRTEYNIWVRVVVDHNSTGPYSYVACNR